MGVVCRLCVGCNVVMCMLFARCIRVLCTLYVHREWVVGKSYVCCNGVVHGL